MNYWKISDATVGGLTKREISEIRVLAGTIMCETMSWQSLT